MKVPYWCQTSIASCSPAALLMVMNFYDPSIKLTRENEWGIWRDASDLVWGGCHPYGMAIAALKRGFKVRLIREGRTLWNVGYPEDRGALHYSIREQEVRAKRLGLKETMKKGIDAAFLEGIIRKGKPVIVMMKLISKNWSIGGLHWVVLTGIEKDCVILNDPGEGGNRRIPMKTFLRAWDGVRDRILSTAKEVLVLEK